MVILTAYTLNMALIPPQDIANDNLFVRAFVTIAMSLNGYGLVPFLLFPVLLPFADRAFAEPLRIGTALPAALFALFQVIGNSFLQTGSLILITYDPGQVLKALLQLTGFFLALYIFLFLFYGWYEEGAWEGTAPKLFAPFLRGSHIFRNTFLLFFLFWLPYMILRYPGLLMGDSMDQLLQALGYMDDTASKLILINPDFYLNNHHPVLHTLLMGALFRLGSMVSDNLGIFLNMLAQYLYTTVTFAAGFYFLEKWGVSERLRLGSMALLLLTPIFVNTTVMVAKDLPYAITCVWYLLFLMQPYFERKPFYTTLPGAIGFSAVLFLMLFTRHNGIYTILLTLPFLLLFGKQHLKFVLSSVFCSLAVFLLVTKLIYPICSITPGSKKEMLSIPIQQTARYLTEYPSEVTPQEQAAIEGVLDYKNLPELYNHYLSDPAKGTWKEAASSSEVSAYFRAWLAMGLRHPLCYIEATLDNTYGMFFIGKNAVWRQTIEESENVTGLLNLRGFDINYPPALTSLRTLLLQCENIFNRLPVLSLLHSAAPYVWTLIILTFLIFRRENKAEDARRSAFGKKNRGALILWLLPSYVTLLITFAGPSNAIEDLRYVFPVMVMLPFAFPAMIRAASAED